MPGVALADQDPDQAVLVGMDQAETRLGPVEQDRDQGRRTLQTLEDCLAAVSQFLRGDQAIELG